MVGAALCLEPETWRVARFVISLGTRQREKARKEKGGGEGLDGGVRRRGGGKPECGSSWENIRAISNPP